MTENYCNNCGKYGHSYHLCKLPIMSIGIVAFRIVDKEIQYLSICRKDTFGFIDFMRGKYSVYNKDYIMNMLKQMTITEKQLLLTNTFSELWTHIWGKHVVNNQYKHEENCSRDKFELLKKGINSNEYTLSSLIQESESYTRWEDPEWGFPKGRRNFQEKDYDCAVREFCEETGIIKEHLISIHNVYPYEEIYTGSNYKSYKHKYYLAYIPYEHSTNLTKFEITEVSKMEWKPFDECISAMRPYNLEKQRLLTNINNTLQNHQITII